MRVAGVSVNLQSYLLRNLLAPHPDLPPVFRTSIQQCLQRMCLSSCQVNEVLVTVPLRQGPDPGKNRDASKDGIQEWVQQTCLSINQRIHVRVAQAAGPVQQAWHSVINWWLLIWPLINLHVTQAAGPQIRAYT